MKYLINIIKCLIHKILEKQAFIHHNIIDTEILQKIFPEKFNISKISNIATSFFNKFGNRTFDSIKISTSGLRCYATKNF